MDWHPWIYYKRLPGTIAFSDYTQSNLEDFKDIGEVHKISKEELKEE